MNNLEQDEKTISLVSEEWRRYIEQLTPLGERAAALAPGSHDAQWRHELYGFLFSQIAVAYVGRLHNDPKYPDFAPMYNQIFNQ